MLKLLKQKSFLENILTNKYIQLTLLHLLLFLTPFILKEPQVLVGSVVNLILILGISRFKLKEVYLALFLPSIAAVTYGMLFSGATSFLLYLIPIIGVSNLLYVLLFKNLKQEYLQIFLPPIVKALFLFSCTYILFKTIGLPEIFLTSMGVIQLITALVGTVVGSRLLKIK